MCFSSPSGLQILLFLVSPFCFSVSKNECNLFGDLVQFDLFLGLVQHHVVPDVLGFELSVPTLGYARLSVKPRQIPFRFQVVCHIAI